MILAYDLPAHADDLNQGVAFEEILVKRSAKLGLFRGELANDLVDLCLAQIGRTRGYRRRRTSGICAGLLRQHSPARGSQNQGPEKRES